MRTQTSLQTGLTVEDCSMLQPQILWCYQGKVEECSLSMETNDKNLFAWYILQGQVEVKQGSTKWIAHPGEWIFGGPTKRHQNFSRNAEIISINFRLLWPSSDSLVNNTVVIPHQKAGDLLTRSQDLVAFTQTHFPQTRIGLTDRITSMGLFFELQSLFSGWVSAYIQTLERHAIPLTRVRGLDSRITKALRLLDQYDWQSRFLESQLAGEIGLSVGHMNRLFIQNLGMTPKVYLQKRRLRIAQEILLDSRQTIKQIAFDLGFHSLSHFSNWFSKTTGKSAKNFRTLQMNSKLKN